MFENIFWEGKQNFRGYHDFRGFRIPGHIFLHCFNLSLFSTFFFVKETFQTQNLSGGMFFLLRAVYKSCLSIHSF